MIRLALSLKCYKNGKMVQSTNMRVPTRFLALIQEKKISEYEYCVVQVTYKTDYWNAFTFYPGQCAMAREEFRKLIEKDLVKEFI